MDEARAMEGVVDVATYRSMGDELAIHGDFRDRIGHVIACAGTFHAASRAAARARDAIRVIVAAHAEASDAGALVGAGEGGGG
jgi:biotin carboxylase